MRRLRYVRILLALLSLIALTACFLDFTGLAVTKLGWTQRMQFVPAVLSLSVATVVAILAVTLAVGRVYCSVVCPLGILQDVVIFFRRLFGFHFTSVLQTSARSVVRVAIAVLFVAGGFVGVHYLWLEPYGIYGRLVSTLLAPLVDRGYVCVTAWLEQRGGQTFDVVETVLPAVGVMVANAAFLALLAGLALWKGRFWCTTVCPVGTALGYTAKFAWLKPRVDARKCVKCGLCAKVCKARCIDVRAAAIDPTQCIGCMDCVSVCGKGAIKWSR